ncbi:MAG: MarR family transcriptional regulator, organic hydroperoxide resistance regulator [Gammaproteobacteria bacterium]|nr:MarR family transcriptional regulator, organic hydroperoxide resistance regulator [Gammaproteobacteria bacterium]
MVRTSKRRPTKGDGLSSPALPRLPAIDPSDRLAHLVKDASKALARSLQARLAQHSVAYGHWTFLRILWVQNGISQTRLSELAGVMRPSTFAAIRVMTKLGYVTRQQKRGNRKKIYIHLTRSGWSLKDVLVPLAVEVNEIAMESVTKAEVAEFRKVLLTIISNLGKKGVVTSPGAAKQPLRRSAKSRSGSG